MGRHLRALAVVVAVLTVGSAVAHAHPASPQTAGVVSSITDGDTLRLREGQRVRLLQVDTPELGTGECYSRAARKVLLNLAPVGSHVMLEADPALDNVDRYGRILRYVHHGHVNVNLELVRRGAAAPYFYGGDRGHYAAALISAAEKAKGRKLGLWGACPSTTLNPTRAVDTGTSGPTTTTTPATGKCDPNYSGGCVPPYPPDLDCADIVRLGITTPIRVVGSDPHRLDGDQDGLGCEADSGTGSPTPAPPTTTTTPATGKCDPNYSGGCVPPYPPDVDCADIRALGIAPVKVIGVDVHRLDGDGDGWGCE